MKRAFLALWVFGGFSAVFADEFFASKIEPILKQRCFECHSHEKKMKGGSCDCRGQAGGEFAHQDGALE
jgi:hypothetical protein